MYISYLVPLFLGVVLSFPFLSSLSLFDSYFSAYSFTFIYVIGASPTDPGCLPCGHLFAALGRHLLFAFSGTAFVASLEGSWFPMQGQRLQPPLSPDS